MKATDLIVSNLERNLGFLQMTLADFTDAEMVVRPAAGANHSAWQVGHLLVAESGILAMAGGTPAELPAGFAERFNDKTAGVDDPAKLASKAELLELFGKVRAATIAWVRSLSDADLSKPGPERVRAFAPTLADVGLMSVVHVAMHMGQVQVIRRKLGKAILF